VPSIERRVLSEKRQPDLKAIGKLQNTGLF
jgi:hypothetical protein